MASSMLYTRASFVAPPLTTQTVNPVLVVRALEFSTLFADVFQIEVINTESRKWRGVVVDTTTGKRVHIGSWTLPVVRRVLREAKRALLSVFRGMICRTVLVHHCHIGRRLSSTSTHPSTKASSQRRSGGCMSNLIPTTIQQG